MKPGFEEDAMYCIKELIKLVREYKSDYEALREDYRELLVMQNHEKSFQQDIQQIDSKTQ